MKTREYILVLLVITYAVLWFGGVGSYAFIKRPPPEAAWAAPSFLFLAGLIVLISSNRKIALLLSLAGLIGFVSEIIGIHTGYPFGRYQYTETMKPAFFNAPLVMIASWIILPAYINQLTLKIKLNRIFLIILCSAATMLIDLLIDPVAIGPMKFWTWIDGGPYYGIPFLNFFGWFIVSTIIFSFLLKHRIENKWHRYTGASVILFFTIIAFAESLLWAGFSGTLILINQATQEYSSHKRIKCHAQVKESRT